jgi:hypothetical protein
MLIHPHFMSFPCVAAVAASFLSRLISMTGWGEIKGMLVFGKAASGTAQRPF